MKVFDRAGRVNTTKTLEMAFDRAYETGISRVVIASTYGDTALKAVEMADSDKIELIVVTHNYGFKTLGQLEMSDETRKQLLQKNVKVHTGTMPFRNIGTAIRQTLGYSQQDLIANTLRLMGQGLKVCVEIAMMAADAGLVGQEDIVTVAGTGRGADTAAIILPASSNSLFEMKIREIIVKPRDW